MAKKAVVVLDVAVEFSGISIGQSTVRIGAKFNREHLDIDRADEAFCERRLVGAIQKGGSDDAGGQSTFIPDVHERIEGAFDVKGFSVKEKTISAGFTFSLKDVDIERLSHFANKIGRIIVNEINLIPQDAPAYDDEEESEVEAEADPSLAVEGDPMKTKITELFEGRDLKALQAGGVKTVADFVRLNKDEFWIDNLPGCGPVMKERIADRMVQYWSMNPEPVEA